MARILVIDHTARFRDGLASALRAAGHETETAANGNEGIFKARAAPPSVILLELSLPPQGGLNVAGACRDDAALKNVPIVLLSDKADRKSILRAAELGIRDFLLKSELNPVRIIERIDRYLSPGAGARARPVNAGPPPAFQPPADLPRLMTRQQCMARIEQATAARPLSGAVAQVLGMAASPSADMKELATMIGRDPVLSTRVLRVANSAAFAGARKVVTSIADAVRNIGISALREIATALSVYEAVPCGGADGFHHMRGWQHSFAAALICQHLAKTSGVADPGTAYLVGLCHDLGQMLFRGEFGREYSEVLQRSQETGRPLDEIERHMLGTTQLDLAKVILKNLALPEDIRRPIEEFHAARVNPAHTPTLPLSHLLRFADSYANGLLMAALPTSEVGPLTKAECKSVLTREDPPRPDIENTRGQILALTPLLARLPEQEERKLSQPMIKNSGKRVCLVRDASLSAFDPLEAALSSLAEVKLSNSWPADLTGCDAVVMAGRRRGSPGKGCAVPVLRLALEEPPPQAGSSVGPSAGAVIECGAAVSLLRLAEFLTPQSESMRQVA